MFALIVLGAAAVGMLLLLSPLFTTPREIESGGRLTLLLTVVVQLLPCVAVVVFWQYSVAHMRIPVFGYTRPDPVELLGAMALFQAIVSGVMFSVLRRPVWKVVIYACLSAAGIFVVDFVGIGVVECMNGNCL